MLRRKRVQVQSNEPLYKCKHGWGDDPCTLCMKEKNTAKASVTLDIPATTSWKVHDIRDSLIKGEGWKGFYSGIGSIEGKVRVTVTVERIGGGKVESNCSG